MEITIADIEKYLEEVKTSINADKYRVEMNDRRQANQDLFMDYLIDEDKRKQILLSLAALDFSEILPNEHVGYEHEMLYVFGKDENLLHRFGTGEELISLYIKINKLESNYVIVISFHKQMYPLKYKFK
ncbi:hypothetical protein H0486_17410 [Lachnospiraceae bacterium MD1]|uniref:Uncharacterized protein n=1 Tax=Variimorphobacter saccharofermentans TaxID=2755051 RepID=A0A839K5P7_9FIRM|nr:hypothetical protein [Variimorphobacter saccharofermentans]MBB2184647.1 hypothetical protein [Variimorphobacter saccharofermentans]